MKENIKKDLYEAFIELVALEGIISQEEQFNKLKASFMELKLKYIMYHSAN